MKKIFTILILAFIIASCSRNEYERELIGNWNNFPLKFRTDIKFYKDSFVAYNYYEKDIGTWKADSNKIYLFFNKSSKKQDRDSSTYFYKLSLNKDTLFSRLTSSKINEDFILLRIKNTWKHFLKEIDLKINLPKANFELIKNDSMRFGVNLYIGYKNEKLVIKSGIKLIDKNIDKYNKSFLIEQIIIAQRAIGKLDENEEKRMNFNLIIDKNVSETEIDSIKNILKIFPNMKCFRVYKNDSANYGKYDIENNGEYWNWFGRYE